MMILRILIFSLLLMAQCGAVELAPDDPQSLAPEWWAKQIDAVKPAPVPRGKEWWRAVVQKNPACRVHSDGCRDCFGGDDSFRCVNPGIACVSGEWVCSDLTH
jgi:hypothetical protein